MDITRDETGDGDSHVEHEDEDEEEDVDEEKHVESTGELLFEFREDLWAVVMARTAAMAAAAATVAE